MTLVPLRRQGLVSDPKNDLIPEIQEKIQELSQEERTLVMLRDELYDGSWESMKKDLEDRKQGRPYIFKLHNRIEDDLNRIEKLKSIEEEGGIDLANYLERPDKEEE